MRKADRSAAPKKMLERALIILAIVLATSLGATTFVHAHTGHMGLAFWIGHVAGLFMLVGMVPKWTK